MKDKGTRMKDKGARIKDKEKKIKIKIKIKIKGKAVIIPKLKFGQDGLIPAIVQDDKTGDVLMIAYMNKESLEITLREMRTCFWSRSRKTLWRKGETSGHVQKIKKIYYDCDKDALLVRVDQKGVACHTGEWSCFFRRLI